jgi:DNA-binding NarL/FixJ family response regulator
MNILMVTPTMSVADRWQDLLAEGQPLSHATSLRELKSVLPVENIDLILLHRVLVDYSACVDIRKSFPLVKIFLFSDNPSAEEGLEFLKTGIIGYANTYITKKRLAEALHVIATGGVWLGQKVIQQLITESHATTFDTASKNDNQQLSLLTAMERKVADLVAKGMTNLVIADDLSISERTVKAHLTAIYHKMHIGNRLSLALLINKGRNR